MKHRQILTFLLVFLFAFILVENVNADENIDISAVKYTNDVENGVEVILVGNGKDYGTEYLYKVYDDDDDQYRNNDDGGNNDDCEVQNCLPENWYTNEFDDSEWNIGAAPFGDEEMDGVTPGTVWESNEGSDPGVLNDNLVIRHYFNYSKEDKILGATLKLVHNNYYVAYLNGQLIRNCYYYTYHDDCYERNPEYWKTNGDNFLTYDGSPESGPNPDWIVDGENLLAILVYDHCCYQGDPHQWIDAELVINVQSWKDKPIVLGDNLALGVDLLNNGEENVSNINVSLEIDGEIFTNETINIQNNSTYEWIVYWTPTRLGEINVTAKVFDKELTKKIHIGYYAYSLNFITKEKSAEIDQEIQYQFNITNEGDVNDNFTFYLSNFPNNWDYSFSPNIAKLEPGESADIKLNISISNDAEAGSYSIFPLIFSQYYSQTVNTLIQSGESGSTEYSYRIWNNSEFPDDFYKLDYNDSVWNFGAAPFGNEELRGIDPNTIWATDDENYTHISTRYWFDYNDSLDFSELRLKIAHDNYYRAYLNGNLIRDCFSGWGCYGNGEYWEETININTSWLNEGENLFAIAARDNTQGWGGGGGGSDGRQWLDSELEIANLRSKLWNFDEIYDELIVSVNETYEYEILTPIITKVIDDTEPYEFTVWILNRGNIEDIYNITVTLNDTENFNIISYNQQLKVPYGADGNIELVISLNENVDEFDLAELNITITSLNSTNNIEKQTSIYAKLYVAPDLVAPATYAVSPELVNSTSFEVQWYVQDWYKTNLESGNDTKYIIIQYSSDNGTNGDMWSAWEIWGNFSVEQEKTLFTGAEANHQYRFRSIGGDDDGRIENKEDKYDNTTFVDLTPPVITINEIKSSGDDDIINNYTAIRALEFTWTSEENNNIIVGYDFYHKLNNGEWIIGLEGFTQRTYQFYANVDGEYQFKVVGTDLAGNKGFDATHIVTIDTEGPIVNISEIPSLTNAENIIIDLELLEDITNFTIFYKLNKEGENNANLEWQEYGSYTPNELPVDVPVQNEYEYQFKILAFDLVGNHGEDIAYTLIDRDKPSKIRNLELAQGNTIINSTTDVLISFMSSQAQDLVEYRIYRSNSANETGELIVEIPYGEQYLSYKDSNVDMGEIYHYSIVAVDRMNFESEYEKGFLDLTVEKETVVEKEEEVEYNLTAVLVGLGIIGGTAAIVTFIGRKSTEEIAQVIGDLPEEVNEEKFSEMDGELVCNACGAMFNPSATSCPACGTLKE